MRQVACIVDGDFFMRRFNYLKPLGEDENVCPENTAKFMVDYCLRHVKNRKKETDFPERLYRIFFYDCPPLERKQRNPISGRDVDLKKTAMYRFRTGLHDKLKESRNVALRLGELDEENGRWKIKLPEMEKNLLNGTITRENLTPDDVSFYAPQKGVDIKMGLDIAHLAYKGIVDKIVLISGDSDFVPAAKLARREGIEFILDPMHATIKSNLQEHIDGLNSPIPIPDKKKKDTA